MAVEAKPVDTRVYMYRKGEARLFDSPADVPAGEGWVDSPVAEEVVASDEPAKKRGRSKVASHKDAHGDDPNAGNESA